MTEIIVGAIIAFVLGNLAGEWVRQEFRRSAQINLKLWDLYAELETFVIGQIKDISEHCVMVKHLEGDITSNLRDEYFNDIDSFLRNNGNKALAQILLTRKILTYERDEILIQQLKKLSDVLPGSGLAKTDFSNFTPETYIANWKKYTSELGECFDPITNRLQETHFKDPFWKQAWDKVCRFKGPSRMK